MFLEKCRNHPQNVSKSCLQARMHVYAHVWNEYPLISKQIRAAHEQSAGSMPSPWKKDDQGPHGW